MLVTEDATEAEILKKMCLKGILRRFKLSVARLWPIGNHHMYWERWCLVLFLLHSCGKVVGCSKWTEDVNKEDLHHARHCRGLWKHQGDKAGPSLCTPLLERLQEVGDLGKSCTINPVYISHFSCHFQAMETSNPPSWLGAGVCPESGGMDAKCYAEIVLP